MGVVAQRIKPGRWRLQLASRKKREDVVEAFPDKRGHPLAIIADLQTARFDVLEKEIIGFQCGNPARGKSNHNDPAAPGERAHCGIEDVTAQCLDYDIDSLIVVSCINLLAQR